MRHFRRIGVIHPHVSIAFHISSKEIVIHTEAGRVTRPLIIIENRKSRFTPEIIKRIKNKTVTWSNLLIGFYDDLKNINYKKKLICLTFIFLTVSIFDNKILMFDEINIFFSLVISLFIFITWT